MKAMIASACLATTVGLSGCTDKAYTGTACNALTTKEKVLNICKPPASAKQMNNGEMLTPRDVSFQKIDDTNALSMAEVLIAPGRTALFVVRFKKSDFYSPPRFIPERLQIFENGAFLSEKIFGSGPYALQKTAENFYKDSSVGLDELFGKNRINMRPYFQKLLASFSDKDMPKNCVIGESQEVDKTHEPQAGIRERVKGQITRLCSGEEILHGKGEREWFVPNVSNDFRITYDITALHLQGYQPIPGGNHPHWMKEEGIFEDGYLQSGTKTFQFGTGPNSYTEKGTFRYTGHTIAGNLYNGTVKLPNGTTFQVVNGKAQK